MYNWDETPDGFEKLPVGLQEIKLFKAYLSQNSNGKSFIAIKGGLTETVDSALQMQDYDDLGNLNVRPHGMIMIYFENEFGRRVLKNLLKSAFGENNLKHLTTNELIIRAINQKNPVVLALVFHEGNYSKFKEFEFQPIGNPDTVINSAELAQAETEIKQPEPQTEETETDDDLPF
jgi:hypothetical protein